MRALIYVVIDIDCEIQSKVRQKTEYLLKVHGIEGYKLFGPYIRYEIPIYQNDAFYMDLLRLEKMIRRCNELEESGVEWMCFGVSAEYTEKLAGYQIKAEQILLPGAFVSEQFEIQKPCEKCGGIQAEICG